MAYLATATAIKQPHSPNRSPGCASRSPESIATLSPCFKSAGRADHASRTGQNQWFAGFRAKRFFAGAVCRGSFRTEISAPETGGRRFFLLLAQRPRRFVILSKRERTGTAEVVTSEIILTISRPGHDQPPRERDGPETRWSAKTATP